MFVNSKIVAEILSRYHGEDSILVSAYLKNQLIYQENNSNILFGILYKYDNEYYIDKVRFIGNNIEMKHNLLLLLMKDHHISYEFNSKI